MGKMAMASAWTSLRMGSRSWTAWGWERRAASIPFRLHLLGGLSRCPLLSLWWEEALGTCSWGAVGPALLPFILSFEKPCTLP